MKRLTFTLANKIFSNHSDKMQWFIMQKLPTHHCKLSKPKQFVTPLLQKQVSLAAGGQFSYGRFMQGTQIDINHS